MDHAWLIRGVGLTVGALSLAMAGATGCGDSGTGGSGAAGGGSVEGGGTVCGLSAAPNSEFCQDNLGDPDCDLVTSQKQHVCGVPLNDPPVDLERSSNVLEYAGSGPPDLGCFEVGNYPSPPGASENVTVTGFARIFSAGCDSHDLQITFFRVQPDGQLGEAVGTAVVTPETCEAVGEASEVDDCDTRWECEYSYPNVPTETELAVRTENGPGSQLWAPLIQYNVYIRNDEVVAGEWSHDVRALAEPDLNLIPQTAIGRPLTPGNGAVAGEVHDCGDVRLTNAVADIDQPHELTTYFTSNEDSPLPEPSADGTSVLGLYAALDVAPGPVVVAAGGFINGEFVTVGQHRAWVYPDTVTSVTFKGLRPYQVSE